MFRPIINKRLELLNGSSSKDNIEDVIFSLTVAYENIINVDIFLTPYIGLLDPKDKITASKIVLNKILNRTYFIENDIELDDQNIILFFSYDTQNQYDNCYIIDLNKNSVLLQIFALNGNLILEKYINSKINGTLDILVHNNPSSVFLFFDTETNGLPNDYKALESDLTNWPRIVQLAFLLYDQKLGMISEGNYIIKPNGFEISIESTKIHGITKERALREGNDITEVLNIFLNIIHKADYLVAHNINFDKKIVGAEFLRNGIMNPINSKKLICTMESTTNFCAIEGKYGYKWPTLQELHLKLFNKNFEEAHDASVDVAITFKCFIVLLKNKIISLN